MSQQYKERRRWLHDRNNVLYLGHSEAEMLWGEDVQEAGEHRALKVRVEQDCIVDSLKLQNG